MRGRWPAAPTAPDVPVTITRLDGTNVTVPFSSLDVLQRDPLGCGCLRWICVRPGGGTVHLHTNPAGHCHHAAVWPPAATSARDVYR